MAEREAATAVSGGGPADPAGFVRAGQSARVRLLGGRYLLEEQVAGGGMASVWRAHDEVLARTVAVKVLHDHLAADPGFRERFRREAVAAAKLTHPNIVSLYDTGREDDRVYLVLEYVEGSTLAEVLAHHGPLVPGTAAMIAQRVALALGYAHERRLVHRDVKPANILLGTDGLVKVTDFGIAKAEDDSAGLTKTGTVMGTAAYVAPEQIVGDVVGGAADQYSLGCVLFEALAGRRPFEGASAVETAALRLEADAPALDAVRADLAPGLAAVVARLLAREPGARYPSCAQVAAALAPFADRTPDATGELVLAAVAAASSNGTPPRGELDAAPRRRRRWLLPVAGVLAVVLAVFGVGLASGFLESQDITSLFAEEVTPTQPPATTAPPAATQAAPEPEPVEVAGLETFDVAGDGENDGDLDHLTDGDPDTTWETERYNTAAFGNLKDGVGFVVDLGEQRTVTGVTLDVTTPGIAVQVRAIDGEPSDDAEDWDVLAERTDTPEGGLTLAPDEPVVTRWLLVYVTGDLQPIRSNFYAAFAEVAVEALP